jgi:RimJ/RimL family protein N-acetyltransferase
VTVVETDRLVLRQWTPDDLEALTEVFAKPEVWRFPFGRGFTEEETASFLDRALAKQDSGVPTPWASELRDSGQVIGYIGLGVPEFLPEVMPAIEIGWRLDPAVWGQGLATEGAVVALDHGFDELGLEEVVSIYQPENVASGRVMQKLGMVFDRDTAFPGRALALRVYRMTRAQWAGR